MQTCDWDMIRTPYAHINLASITRRQIQQLFAVAVSILKFLRSSVEGHRVLFAISFQYLLDNQKPYYYLWFMWQ